MHDCNQKHTPAATMSFGTDADGDTFCEDKDYASVVGMLMYLSSNSRPDIQLTVHQFARFSHSPRKSHGEAVLRICPYLIRTQGQGLTFNSNSNLELDCYVDADFSGLWKHKDDQDPVCV
jgi:hypothetical protein